jgi:copper chaperone CopZ
MRSVVIGLFLLSCSSTYAQFKWAEVGVEGLTCSMCARSVEIKVRKLDFVADVKMDLQATKMRVEFKPDRKVDMKAVAEAVDDAGFSVGYLHAAYVFKGIEVHDGECVSVDDEVFTFVETGDRLLEGETVLKFLGPLFLPKREFEKRKGGLASNCEHGDLCFVTVL